MNVMTAPPAPPSPADLNAILSDVQHNAVLYATGERLYGTSHVHPHTYLGVMYNPADHRRVFKQYGEPRSYHDRHVTLHALSAFAGQLSGGHPNFTALALYGHPLNAPGGDPDLTPGQRAATDTITGFFAATRPYLSTQELLRSLQLQLRGLLKNISHTQSPLRLAEALRVADLAILTATTGYFPDYRTHPNVPTVRDVARGHMHFTRMLHLALSMQREADEQIAVHLRDLPDSTEFKRAANAFFEAL